MTCCNRKIAHIFPQKLTIKAFFPFHGKNASPFFKENIRGLGRVEHFPSEKRGFSAWFRPGGTVPPPRVLPFSKAICSSVRRRPLRTCGRDGRARACGPRRQGRDAAGHLSAFCSPRPGMRRARCRVQHQAVRNAA